MTIRRLLVPLTVAVVTLHAGYAAAQGAFPAPLPNQGGVQPNDPAFPPVNGRAPSASIGTGPSSPFPSNGAAPAEGNAELDVPTEAEGAAPLTGGNAGSFGCTP